MKRNYRWFIVNFLDLVEQKNEKIFSHHIWFCERIFQKYQQQHLSFLKEPGILISKIPIGIVYKIELRILLKLTSNRFIILCYFNSCYIYLLLTTILMLNIGALRTQRRPSPASIHCWNTCEKLKWTYQCLSDQWYFY